MTGSSTRRGTRTPPPPRPSIAVAADHARGGEPAAVAQIPVGRPIGLVALVVVACGAASLWIVAAILTAGHGFDITDEGFYLLSYRWWSSNQWNFTGAQYLYGPIFQALHYDIAALRLVRLAMVVVTHLAFGWSFMRWLRLRRPTAPISKLWEVGWTAAILAVGGLVYGWLPLSPSYNDLVLLGALLAMALTLQAATRVERGLTVPAWLPATSGAVALAMLLTKWSSILVVALLAIVLAFTVVPRGGRAVGRVVCWWFAGIVLAAVIVHFCIVALTTAIPRMVTVNGWIAGESYSLGPLLYKYVRTSVGPLARTVLQHAPLYLAILVGVVGRRPVTVRLAWILGAIGVGGSAWWALQHNQLSGGAIHQAHYPIVFFGVFGLGLLTAALVLLRDRSGRFGGGRPFDGPASSKPPAISSSLSRHPLRDAGIVGMLLALPVVQAMGTSNPIFLMAINGFAAWMAIIIAIVTGIEAEPTVARRLTVLAAAWAVLAVPCVATGGLWRHPYLTGGRAQTTSSVPGVSALASVKLDPVTAAKYSDLYGRLQPWIEPGGRAMMAFDMMPGIVLLLNGRQVGEAWNSTDGRARTAAGIRQECAQGPPWWGSRLPILLFNRPIDDTEIGALKACHLDFAADYRLLAPVEQTMGLSVYVPAATAGTGQ
jgi:hypothetical protein